MTPATEREAVEKVLTGIVDAANGGKIDEVLSYFAEDGVAMPSDEMPVFGTRLIRPRLQPFLDRSLRIFLTSEEVEVSGNLAFARGYFSGGTVPYIGYNEYLVSLRKDSSGGWKIARLMWHPMFPKGPVVYT